MPSRRATWCGASSNWLVGAETRTWWRDGRCVLQTAPPDTADEQPVVPDSVLAVLGPAVAGLGLPFATANEIRREGGEWRVVELGDWQVSDRPTTSLLESVIAALADGSG
jgi:hypothetical protein